MRVWRSVRESLRCCSSERLTPAKLSAHKLPQEACSSTCQGRSAFRTAHAGQSPCSRRLRRRTRRRAYGEFLNRLHRRSWWACVPCYQTQHQARSSSMTQARRADTKTHKIATRCLSLSPSSPYHSLPAPFSHTRTYTSCVRHPRRCCCSFECTPKREANIPRDGSESAQQRLESSVLRKGREALEIEVLNVWGGACKAA